MRYLIIVLLAFASNVTFSQITEYNESVGWKYVKSEDLKMVDGVWYNTEFPAEVGYDYIFILNHKLDSAMASIQVFNLQDEQIKVNNKDASKKVIDLNFDVSESGIYRVYFGINEKRNSIHDHSVQFMLVRRKKV